MMPPGLPQRKRKNRLCCLRSCNRLPQGLQGRGLVCIAYVISEGHVGGSLGANVMTPHAFARRPVLNRCPIGRVFCGFIEIRRFHGGAGDLCLMFVGRASL
jgi:hypothetical protein